jgi:glycosyltransferase involved in cell wall biosynthesis
MREQIFVSIIVPVYNGGKGFERCLSGIRSSTYTSYELIVVDNGSTDGSASIANSHRAEVLHCPGPSGPGAARNMGAQNARGAILFFVDADVVVYPDTLGRVVRNFEQDTELAAVFGSYDDSPAAKNFLSQYKNLLHHFMHQNASSQACTFWGGCGAIQKDVFYKVGGFDQERYPTPSIEDIELGCRMHSLGYRIFLDKQVQAKHLKEWRFASLLRTDILYRAVPWTELMLSKYGLVNDLNIHISQRISAALVGLTVLCVPFLVVIPSLAYGMVVCLALIGILNRKLFLFFLRRNGPIFCALAFTMHLFYYLYSGVIFVLCSISYRLRRKEAVL